MQLPGGGLPPPIDPPVLECEEPELINTLRWTDREYVYGPGYVDEFILQIDQSGNILYMLQDANYNVVAIISGGCGPGVPPENCGTGVPPVGTLLEQYAYEPYGTVLAADNLDVDQYGVTRHAVNRVGFQGLFFERYDGSYFETSIAPNVAGMYYARNRFYSPALGRFLQRDVNETALPIITALAMNGLALEILMDRFDASALYGDGMNLYLFAGARPLAERDPCGLNSVAGVVPKAGGPAAAAAGALLVAMLMLHDASIQLTQQGVSLFQQGDAWLGDALMNSAEWVAEAAAGVLAATVFSGDRDKYKPDATIEAIIRAVPGLAALARLGLKSGGGSDPNDPNNKPPGWFQILKMTWKQLNGYAKQKYRWAKQLVKVIKRGSIKAD